MAVFKVVSVMFRGQQFEVKANDVLPLIAEVEEVVSLMQLTRRHSPPLAKLSMAYGIVLRYAGASVTDEQVYESAFEAGGTDTIANAVSGLLAMMIPPSRLQDQIQPTSDDTEKKSPPTLSNTGT